MTDPAPWHSPSGDNSPARPRYGEFAPPSGPSVPDAVGAGWTPPPRPGLIPLRPLTLGAILGASFQVLRRNPRPTFGAALLLNGIVAIVALVVVGLVTVFAVSRTFGASDANAADLAAGATAMIVLSALIPVVLSIVITAILQGIISLEVARGSVGEKLRFGGLWRQAKGRIGALIGWSLLIALALGAAVTIIVLIIVALTVGTGGSTEGIVGAILVGMAAGAGFLVVVFWVGTRISLVPSALMIERLPLRDAIARSWSLTTGYFWRTLGIQLLVNVIIQTVSQIITFPVSVLLGLGTTLLNPSGDQTALIVGTIAAYVVLILVTLVFGAIATIVQTASTALIYIDLRMRKEGLDLELSRFVEARQAGNTAVIDPYLHPVPGTPPTEPATTPRA